MTPSLACYTSCPTCNLLLSKSYFLAQSFLIGSSEFRLKVKCLRPKKYSQGYQRAPFCPPTLHNLYINDAPETSGIFLALFAGDTCLYTTDRKECHVLRMMQHGITSLESWCEKLNKKSTMVTHRASIFLIAVDWSKLVL